MKTIKFGDLTVRQLAEICNSHPDCDGCPFYDDDFSIQCGLAEYSTKSFLDEEIELPDEEVKNDAVH